MHKTLDSQAVDKKFELFINLGITAVITMVTIRDAKLSLTSK